MAFNNIQRGLSIALLLVFSMPAVLPATYSNTVTHQSALQLDGAVRLTSSDSKITLSLRDSDVRQVLRMFADKAGLNIVFHSSVSGKVTLDLVNTNINEAFNLVLQISGLNYYKQGNTMIVMSKSSPDNAAYSKQEMFVFPIKYVSAKKIAKFLNKNVFEMKKAGLSGVDAATVNNATNELIVFGMQSDVAIVEKVIEQFDREPFSKTYAVNHTTPAEMANMICSVLLPSRGMGSDDSSDESFSSSGTEDAETPLETAAPNPTSSDSNGTATGGAASASDSSGSEASSGGSDSGLKLGENIIACSDTSSTSGGNVAPFDVQNLSISYFPQRGTITVIGGSAAQISMIEAFIKAHDVKQPQAMLEVQLVELNEDGSKEFNNSWNIDTHAFQMQFDGNTGITTMGRDATPGTREYMHLQRASADAKTLEDHYVTRESWYGNNAYISWQMQYLIENQKGRTLANPKILITNGQESKIDLTEDYIEKVTSEYLSTTASGQGAVGQVEKTYTIGDDLGIKISLTPFISPEGYVTVNIKPEYSTIAGKIDDAATLLNRRNLDLKNVRIKDGETLVIGGMMREFESKTVRKIPVLGDLPVVGAVFRSSSTNKTKTELVIMLTPKIIKDSEDVTTAKTL